MALPRVALASSLRSRVALTAGVLSLAIAAPAAAATGGAVYSSAPGQSAHAVAGSAAASPQTVTKKLKIDTTDAWDGSSSLAAFGNPNTATYGQVITTPDGASSLKSFEFYLSRFSGAGSIVLRGELYAWDGTKATGDELWESKKKSVDLEVGVYDTLKFKVKGAELEDGQQYVVFLTVSKDFEDNPVDSLAQWGFVTTDDYADGYTVWINDGGDESQWTSTGWSYYDHAADFATKMTFKK